MSKDNKEDVFDRQSVRSALKLWHYSQKLGEHALSHLQTTKEQRQQERVSYSDTLASAGIALRHVLSKAIESMKPDEPTPDYNDPQWRHYVILQQQYIKERRASQIRDMLGVSESGYFKDQRNALDRVSSILRDSEEKAIARAASLSAEESKADFVGEENVPPPSVWSVARIDNLPLQPTPFVGRKKEVAQIMERLLSPDCRLMTVLGAGGIGKTRLALEVARQLLDHFEQGVCWIPLSEIQSADLLIATILETLQPNTHQQSNLEEQLQHLLGNKKILLIIDNFEHLTNHAELINKIIGYAPSVKIMVTSRERLNLMGEWIVEVHGFALPDTIAADVQMIRDNDAVQLFLNAATRSSPDFVHDDKTMPCILELCKLLDGMPLGIELAASWLSLLSCKEIVREIKKNLDMLETPMNNVPDRHRSLRGVFEHSWNLLSEGEQSLFRKLAVFRGAFTRESAEHIADASLMLLRGLHNKSLLKMDDGGRYRLHELIRQYAFEELAKNDEHLYTVAERHSNYFMGFLQQQAANLRGGSEQMRTLRDIQSMLSDIRSAWEWSVLNDQHETIAETAESLHLAYLMLNYHGEGETVFGEAAVHCGQSDTAPCSQRLCVYLTGLQAVFKYRLGKLDEARTLFAESLTHLQQNGSDHQRAYVGMWAVIAGGADDTFDAEALMNDAVAVFTSEDNEWALATCYFNHAALIHRLDTVDKNDRVHPLVTKSLHIRQLIDDKWGIPECFDYLGHVAYERGEYEKAEQHGQNSLEMYQEIGDRKGLAYALYILGQVTSSTGDYDRSQQYYEDSLLIEREFNNPREIARGLDSVGYVTFLSNDLNRAEKHYRESLELSRKHHDLSGTAWSLHNLGDIAFAREQYDLADEFYSQSHEKHQSVNGTSWGRIVALYKLGRVSVKRGRVEDAHRHFSTTLDLAVRTDRVREATDTLLELTELLFIKPGHDLGTAVQVLTFITQSGAATHTQEIAQHHLKNLSEHTPAHQYDEARQQGQKLTLPEAATLLQKQGVVVV